MPRTGPGMFDKTAGKEIKNRRKEKKITQKDLGKKVGVSYQMIQKYEKGKSIIPAGVFIKIATILKVSPVELFKEVMKKLDPYWDH